jgi:hypothetical protein
MQTNKWTDRQTDKQGDVMKLTVTFSQFCEEPTNHTFVLQSKLIKYTNKKITKFFKKKLKYSILLN